MLVEDELRVPHQAEAGADGDPEVLDLVFGDALVGIELDVDGQPHRRRRGLVVEAHVERGVPVDVRPRPWSPRGRACDRRGVALVAAPEQLGDARLPAAALEGEHAGRAA